MQRSTKQSTQALQPGQITLLLADITNPESLQTLVQLVYGELHHIAVHYCRLEPPGRTLQPTALLNESLIRFIENRAAFKNHRYFFASAARTMRRILVDGARRRDTQKRGGKQLRTEFREAERIGFENPAEVIDLDSALIRLLAVNPSWCEIVDLRIFGGLTTSEAARVLNIGESTARRRWAKARAWLRTDLEPPQVQ